MPVVDEQYMRRCFDLALQGAGTVAPNPMVGAVMVCNGNIIGEGYHQHYGGPHAEVMAIASVKEEDKSLLPQSTLYVNLEPCSHTGKTPPCANLIAANNISKVVIGTVDPNPLVSGKGISFLKQAGVAVTTGILHDDARQLNRRFFTFMERKRPYIILKWAQTLDGFTGKENQRIAITNRYSNTLVHKWRSEEAAIMVGTHTALIDNPKLDSRFWNNHNPVRVVVDRQLRLPETLHLFDGSVRTIVITEQEKHGKTGLDYLRIRFDSHLPEKMLAALYDRSIQSVLVEGGSVLIQSFIDSGLWDEARIFMAPMNLGKGVAAPRTGYPVAASTQVGGDQLLFQFHAK